MFVLFGLLFLAAYAGGAFTPRDTSAPLLAQRGGLEQPRRADAAYEAAQKSQQGISAAPNQKAIDDLGARVAALEQAMKTAEARIATSAGADRAGRLAFTAAALRGAVARGEPYARELGALR